MPKIMRLHVINRSSNHFRDFRFWRNLAHSCHRDCATDAMWQQMKNLELSVATDTSTITSTMTSTITSTNINSTYPQDDTFGSFGLPGDIPQTIAVEVSPRLPFKKKETLCTQTSLKLRSNLPQTYLKLTSNLPQTYLKLPSKFPNYPVPKLTSN